MKKTIKQKALTFAIIILVGLLFSCSKECDYPPAPYGTPNDVTEYSSSGYNTITYYYYCYNGRYTAVTYTNTEWCRWEVSYFYSNCI
jgi:hypothetical protein